MSLVIDIILAVVLLFAVINGARRGFIKSSMRLLSIIVALVCVYNFTPSAADYIQDNIIGDKVHSYANEKITEILPSIGEQTSLSDKIDETPEAFYAVADRFGVDFENIFSFIKIDLNDLVGATAVSGLAEKVANPIANAISKTVAGALIFIAVMLIMWVVTFILDKLFRLPVLKALNKLLGFIFGIVSGALLVWFISALLIALVPPLSSFNPSLFNDSLISNSAVLNFIKTSGLA